LKKYLIFLLLFISITCFGADLKITELTEDTTPTSDDLVATVNAPGSSPANRKSSLSNLIKWFYVPGGATNVTTITGNYALGITLTGGTAVTFPTSGTLATTVGNVATATALAADPTNCNAGSYPLGIDASGNAESCTAISYPTQASLHVDDILTALGIASEATNSGSYTGSTIADSQTFKAAIQAVETAVELRPLASSMATDNSTASHGMYKDSDGHVENLVVAIDAHAASTTITLIPGICPIIHNASQAAADINNALPALAEGKCFVMQVRTAQAANYWRLTAATGNTVCLDGTCDKDYVSFAAPAVANKVSCIAMGTTYWDCETIRGTATTD
jgi:hypothetical protein